jgi:hypothetical protein
MLKLSSRITFNEFLDSELVYTFVNQVEISSSWANITDTCKIVIPKKITLEGKDIAIGDSPVFKRGDAVKVELGYDDNLKVVFRGYITKVILKMPITLECEDLMYELKKQTVPNLSYSSVGLTKFIKDINPNLPYVITQEQALGKMRVSNSATVVQILDFLRKEYSIYSYVQNGTLYIGRPYWQESPKEHVFGFEENVITDSLEYQNGEDVDIKVRAYGIRSSDNAIIEGYFPSKETEGEQHEIKIDNVGTESDYVAIAKRHYEANKFTGYRGTFTTFGAPLVNHGDVVHPKSNTIPERNGGKYLTKEVKRTFGMDGYRQVITLDRKVG